MSFVHLHVHSHFSFLDALSSPTELVFAAKERGMSAIALTDHGQLGGLYEFYTAYKEYKIKPIIGVEAYFLTKKKFNKFVAKKRYPKYNHIVLLCQNETGWKNLKLIHKIASKKYFYYKTIITDDILRGKTEGLICLTACIRGVLGGKKFTGKNLGILKNLFGDKLYGEIQALDMKEQFAVNERVMNNFDGERIVATADVHYINQEDKKYQDALIAIQRNSSIAELKVKGEGLYTTEELWLKNKEQMYNSFLALTSCSKYYPKIGCNEMLDNSTRIANVIEEFNIVPDGQCFPKVDKAKNFKKHLIGLVNEKCYKNKKKYYKRIKKEISVIEKNGFQDYFYIVADIVKKARQKGIPVGPGRGSVGSSLVAYLLGITDIDPLKFQNMYFERFLNEDRIEAPDIDLDFGKRRRNEVKEFIKNDFGLKCVANVGTFGRIGIKQAIKDVVSIVYGFEKEIANELTAGLETVAFVQGTKEELLSNYDEVLKKNPTLSNFMRKHEEINETVKKLLNTPRFSGIHASGVVISKNNLLNWIPVSYHGGIRSKIANKELVTDWPLKDLTKAGIMKIDILGLQTLDVLYDTADLVYKNRNCIINFNFINLEDKNVFKIFKQGRTLGIFQLEKSHAAHLVQRISPDKFSHIVDMCALIRPSSLSEGMHETYIDRKNGLEDVEYIHPDLEPILKDTQGIMLYQENTMRLVKKIGGLKLVEADSFRKAQKLKKESAIRPYKDKFFNGAKERGYSQDVIDSVWKMCAASSRYNFNIAHSTAYALIAYRCAWMKTYYPNEFYVSLMNSEIHSGDKNKTLLRKYIEEARGIGVKIIRPNVNLSKDKFILSTIEPENKIQIIYPLNALKDVGDAKAKLISSMKFDSFDDYLRLMNKQADLRSTRALLLAGAFRDFGKPIEILKKYWEYKKNRKIAICKNCNSVYINNSIIKSLKCEECPKSNDKNFDLVDLNSLTNIKFSERYLNIPFGFPFNPLAKYEKILKQADCDPIISVYEAPEGSFVKVPGICGRISEIVDRNGNDMAFVEFSYRGTTFTMILFSSDWKKYRDTIKSGNVYLMGGIVVEPGKLKLGRGVIVNAKKFLDTS